MPDLIKNILFNPTGFTLNDLIKHLSQNDCNIQDLNLVLGEDAVSIVEKGEVIQEINPDKRDKSVQIETNLIVLWGIKNSGKSSLLFSLLSLKGMRSPNENSDANADLIVNLFRNKTKRNVIFPKWSESNGFETVNVKYKPLVLKPSTPITFLEVNHGVSTLGIDEVLSNHEHQIHLLCLDPQQELTQQINYFKQVIIFLERKKYLDKANAIYLIVTKADQMRVPQLYLDNAAQTFVQRSADVLWRDVKRISYNKQIYNVQPIVSSVGDFVLKDFMQPDNSLTERMFENQILPKCHSTRCFLGRFLEKGNRGGIVILCLLLLCGFGWGVYTFWKSIDKPPTTPVTPFDYQKYFLKMEKDSIKGRSYESSYRYYDILRADLHVESHLRNSEGTLLLPDNVINESDSVLTNDFGKILTNKCEELFNSIEWTSDKSLNLLSWQLNGILRHTSLEDEYSDSCKQYKNYISTYHNLLLPVIKKAKMCKSMKEVEEYIDKADKWMNVYPFCNDAKLHAELKVVPQKAFQSYTDYLCERTDSFLMDFKKKRNRYEKQSLQADFLEKSDYITVLIKELHHKTKDTLTAIDLLIQVLERQKGDKFENLQKKLKETKKSVLSVEDNC